MKATVLLTPAGSDDIEPILKIETAVFAQPWGRRAILDEFSVRDAFQLVARPLAPPHIETTVIGYLFARMLTDEMHLMKIAVDPRWRKRGTATALLDAGREAARRRGAAVMVLEVRPSNLAAIGFYRQAGFRTIGKRPNYYPQTGESALVMLKHLKEAS